MKKSTGEWTVYIIQTTCQKLYTGITTDVARRFEEHQQGAKGARYFGVATPEKVVFTETHPDRASASKREYAIKQMSRSDKLKLITSLSYNGDLQGL